MTSGSLTKAQITTCIVHSYIYTLKNYILQLLVCIIIATLHITLHSVAPGMHIHVVNMTHYTTFCGSWYAYTCSEHYTLHYILWLLVCCSKHCTLCYIPRLLVYIYMYIVITLYSVAPGIHNYSKHCRLRHILQPWYIHVCSAHCR